MYTKSRRISALGAVGIAAGLLFAFPTSTCGMSGTSMAASEGQPLSAKFAEIYGWPEGTLTILNDPLRGDGWNPWFTEWPNDLNHYAMKVKGPADVQHLIDLLAKIKDSPVQIFLDAQAEPRGLGFTTTLPEGNGIGAMFSIGSQKQIDRWYEGLPEVEPGVRKFGVHRYEKTPIARPPTLTLYTGNGAVDLATLRIPAKIVVRAGYSDRYRQEHKEDKAVAEVEQFVKEHEAKRGVDDPEVAGTVQGATEE